MIINKDIFEGKITIPKTKQNNNIQGLIHSFDLFKVNKLYKSYYIYDTDCNNLYYYFEDVDLTDVPCGEYEYSLDGYEKGMLFLIDNKNLNKDYDLNRDIKEYEPE